jgi:putative membrane protein
VSLQPLPLGWSFDPAIVVGLLATAAWFAWYRRGHPGPDGGSPLLFWPGLACFALALVSPLDSAADRYLLSAHMVQHILITMIGPPLLLAGLPRALGRTLPRFLVNPWLTVVLFNVVLTGWHYPPLYDATLRNEALHILEHLMFMGTAVLFWWPILGPANTRDDDQPMSPLMKIAYLAIAGVPPTVVGMTMALAPNPLYGFYELAPRLVAEVSATLDQQLAGLLMFGLGNLIYFVPISVLFFRIGEEQESLATGS